MFIASIETRHFDIEAYGTTEDFAVQALVKAWNRHRAQYPDAGSLIDQGDINVREAIAGQARRDGETL